jgi:hypothetical protein
MIEIDEKRFTDALNAVAATDDGKIILACLKEYCHFDGDILAVGSLENTYANAHMRRAYLFFRSRIRAEYLKSIEHDFKRKVTQDDNGNADRKRGPRRSDRPEQ